MDKIKQLLVKAGCKTELVDQICESLDTYKTSLRETYERDYAAKVEQAKKVCIEETETHKRELARRLQIFCETKEASIEAQLVRQSALSESDAQTKLDRIATLVSGIEHNGELNGQATAALDVAKRQLQQLAEERKQAIEKANRQTAIAEKVLKQNRALSTEVTKLRNSSAAVTENRMRPATQRIDTRRSGGQPVTTRRTLTESQDRRPPQNTVNNVRTTGSAGGPASVSDVAAAMEEDLI